METRYRSRKQVGEWKQVKDEAQRLLNLEQKLRTKINSEVFAILLSNQSL